jgi:hypothetical protein
MNMMARRLLTCLLCLASLALLAVGFSGCKEEKATPQEKTAPQQEKTPPSETEGEKTPQVPEDTLDFEEEEGVQQESPPQYDY